MKNNPNIIEVGFQNDVRPFFALSNCLVFPSYREGFPNVVMQAGAMGLPSIVSDINGCNEIIKNDINGIIIPPKNTDALHDAMYKIVEDNDFRKILIKDTRKLIVERYEQHIVWKTIKDQYDLLLKGH